MTEVEVYHITISYLGGFTPWCCYISGYRKSAFRPEY